MDKDQTAAKSRKTLEDLTDDELRTLYEEVEKLKEGLDSDEQEEETQTARAIDEAEKELSVLEAEYDNEYKDVRVEIDASTVKNIQDSLK